ncbi:ferritin-like protein [Bradyrhizobium sp. 45]|uniref:ferritin-like domain-containing protein n=1 Tax=Bradyrhizobium sp. 45 TaxID=1043587 RepID=UPI001FF8BE7A|nr:ferritin-like protein [Bradyrhizobium sp. 45]MCK1307649.1 ferritin-like protein [Bradyrhizobium sp. 45]
MKTIAEFVSDRISTVSELRDALQTAMQLEFSTIPPYLCAQWSINSDPAGIEDMIGNIVVQEMYHFALAGNLLTAIGGLPNVANPSFIPTYPTNVLPGGIPQALPVDLKPLTLEQVRVFMQIEYPEFTPIAFAPTAASIGAFYTTIAEAFTTIAPPIDPNAFAVASGEAKPIRNLADALAAISLIKGEGEGTEGSPDQPASGNALAHYYIFKQMHEQRALVQDTAGHWSFSGPAIPLPTSFDFKRSAASPSPSLAFNQELTKLLNSLQTCWTAGARPNIGAMFRLKTLGEDLIRQGIRPEFAWAP